MSLPFELTRQLIDKRNTKFIYVRVYVLGHVLVHVDTGAGRKNESIFTGFSFTWLFFTVASSNSTRP